MDEIKRISSIDFNGIVSKHNFQRDLLLKDYYLTLILYLIKDVNGIYFKGGTALNKIFLNHARLSEDIDFTLTRNEKEVRDEIKSILEKTDFIESLSEGKNVDGFLRMIIRCKSEIGESEIFIDLSLYPAALLRLGKTKYTKNSPSEWKWSMRAIVLIE